MTNFKAIMTHRVGLRNLQKKNSLDNQSLMRGSNLKYPKKPEQKRETLKTPTVTEKTTTPTVTTK